MARMTAPQVKHYIDYLSRLPHSMYGASVTFDEKTYRLMDTILEHLKEIEPAADNGARILWLKVDRGPIEDFGDVNEWLEEGYCSSKEEFEEEWLAYFPDETCWLDFGAIHIEDNGYKAIQLNHRIIVTYDPKAAKGFAHDVGEFMEWLAEAVDEAIAAVKDGTYNSDIEQNLPAQHRTGTILRSAMWEVDPEERDAFFQDFAQGDVETFCRLIQDNPDEWVNRPRLPSFTANEFYRCCSLGYEACGYPIEGLSAKEQYEKFADGRDEGLGEIDPDSPEAFEKWRSDSKNRGGHPWEVCRGGNSTHVSLFVLRNSEGYCLSVAGRAYTRTAEAIKFFLALYAAGYPVSIYDGKFLVSRLLGTELVGIVPDNVTPKYCETSFPGQKVHSFMNLPSEDREKYLPHCVWQPEKPVKLVSPSNSKEGLR